ncbi:MAG: hypothetical protein ACRCYU_07350 [Nocardioides sp.]
MTLSASSRVSHSLTVDISDMTPEQQLQLEEQVERAVHRVLHPEDEEYILGWTPTTLTIALARLERDSGRVQAMVIREALRHNGYITRDRVYRIGQYPKDRMLRGFTRPVNRIVNSMKQAGEIPSDAAEILSPSYQDGVQADGFQVDAALATLLD